MIGTGHPLRFFVSYKFRQAHRSFRDFFGSDHFSLLKFQDRLPVAIAQASSPLFRRLQGVPDELFRNKGHNLRLAAEVLNGIRIGPGEVFSLWRLVGPPTARRGFKPGLMIQGGRAVAGIGGGLCQVSNLLHWLALHSDLEVIERHRHSFDLFPDEDRSVPFGTGATIFYNYKDLRFRNPTSRSYQFDLSVDDDELTGELLCSEEPANRYEVLEKEASFSRAEGEWWRHNQLWRVAKGSSGGELLFENHCLCRYEPKEVRS